MQVTNLEQLKKKANGRVEEFPGFFDDEPFVARVRTITLTGLVLAGKLPNPLLAKADKIFKNIAALHSGKKKSVTKKEEADILALEEVLLNEILVEPTLADIREAGLELTPLQKAFIIEAGQGEVNRLERFRDKLRGVKSNQDEQEME